MAARENYTLHKLHSLTGVIPVGFYLAQHLTLNSFTLAGADAYNGVINFFEGMPKHVLYGLKAFIWLSLIFHAVYGFAIVGRAKFYRSPSAPTYAENRYFQLQRITGIFLMVFLVYHLATTSIANSLYGPETTIHYQNWAAKLSSFGYLMLVFYALGVITAAYHFSYGIWSFCIRWGLTVSEAAQKRVYKFSGFAFVGLSLVGLLALAGFFYTPFAKKPHQETVVQATSAPEAPIPVRY